MTLALVPEPIDPNDERHIAKLHPSLRWHARTLLEHALEDGIDLTITQSLRTMQEQGDLFAQGRSRPGPRVTNAPAGFSWHNFGLAFDVAIDRDPGVGIKPAWPNEFALWRHIGEIGELIGLEWGGRWKRPDLPHFQRIAGLTLAAARRGLRPDT
jgi:peptidoglycan L-alanyl-D-glutamate endopeptidase CwlK